MHTLLGSAALLLSLAPLAAARSTFVPDVVVPDDFATIQSALDTGVDLDGDGRLEVLVRAGTYAESVLVTRSDVALVGESSQTTLLVGTSSAPPLRVEDAARVELRMLGLLAQPQLDGLVLRGVRDATLEKLHATQCRNGFVLARCARVELRSCVAEQGLADGFRVTSCAELLLQGCESRDNLGNGLRIARARGVGLLECTLAGNGLAGLAWRDVLEGVVLGSAATANRTEGMHLERVVRSSFRSNRVSENLGDGLQGLDTLKNLFSKNLVVDNGGFGVELAQSSADDFHATLPGPQPPAGDNELHGNGTGAFLLN